MMGAREKGVFFAWGVRDDVDYVQFLAVFCAKCRVSVMFVQFLAVFCAKCCVSVMFVQ